MCNGYQSENLLADEIDLQLSTTNEEQNSRHYIGCICERNESPCL